MHSAKQGAGDTEISGQQVSLVTSVLSRDNADILSRGEMAMLLPSITLPSSRHVGQRPRRVWFTRPRLTLLVSVENLHGRADAEGRDETFGIAAFCTRVLFGEMPTEKRVKSRIILFRDDGDMCPIFSLGTGCSSYFCVSNERSRKPEF